jgi:methylase of polypeptide subunit release factors
MLDFKSARHWAQELIEQALHEGAAAVDATMGGGGDTLFLCKCVGPSGRVYAFDIQKSALDRTRERLLEAGCLERVRLFPVGHENVAEHVPEPVDAIVFNLGWLPGEDKRVTTKTDTTLFALDAGIALLKPRGLLTVCAYPGHQEGEAELRAVCDWAQRLPSAYQAMMRCFLNAAHPAPALIAIQRLV